METRKSRRRKMQMNVKTCKTNKIKVKNNKKWKE